MMPPLVAIVEVRRKVGDHAFRLWLPIFLIWLLLLPFVLLLLPFVIIIGLIAGIRIFAALGQGLRILNSLNGTDVEIDKAGRRVFIHIV